MLDVVTQSRHRVIEQCRQYVRWKGLDKWYNQVRLIETS